MIRHSSFFRTWAVAFALILCCTYTFGQGIPLKNWTVGKHLGIATNGDISSATPFIAVTPCRIVDTRNAVGPYGGPSMVGGAARTFNIPGGPCTGIPASAAAYSLNFTVVNVAAPDGFLTPYPTGSTRPLVSALNFTVGQIIGNSAIVPAGTSGSIDVYVNVGTNLIIDINGYYMSGSIGVPWNAGQHMYLYANSSSEAFFVWNKDTTSNFAPSIRGYMDATVNGRAAVRAESVGSTGATIGLLALNASTSNGAAAVSGQSTGATGAVYGVMGKTSSLAGGASAVFGQAGTAAWAQSANCGGCINGVRGIADSTSYNAGISGEGTSAGVLGQLVTATGSQVSWAVLGFSAADGIYTPNHLTASGGKSFVEPHPTDATKVIKYVDLEGPEAGTYFRGRGKFQGGVATIDVPEDFRIVSDEEGLTIQITPIGQTASVAVLQINLNQITVKGTRDVEFFYHVNGVRRALKDWQPVQDVAENKYFVPRSANARIESVTTYEELKKRLIQNGTFNADGSVNMGTAERLGWAQKWREQEQQK